MIAGGKGETDGAAYVRALFDRSIELKRRVATEQAETIAAMADRIASSIAAGGAVYFCGNGGSAADAQHLAAELVVRLRPHVNRRAFPALALAVDSSAVTACGNDYGFDRIYARMIEAFAKAGDVLVGITTSGRSRNVVEALREARRRGVATLGFLGGEGGLALAQCDIALVVPSTETGRIQESHIAAGHAMLELVENWLEPEAARG